MITEDALSRSMRETSGLSPATATARVRAVAEAQPELFALVAGLTEVCSLEATSLAFMMLVTILRAFELGTPHPLPQITRGAVTRAYRRGELAMRAMMASSGEQSEEASKGLPQPFLLRFVAETVMDENLPLSPQESSVLFFVLVTVIDALDSASRRRVRRSRTPVSEP